MCSVIFEQNTLLQLSILKARFEVLLSGLYLLLYLTKIFSPILGMCLTVYPSCGSLWMSLFVGFSLVGKWGLCGWWMGPKQEHVME